MIAPPPVDQLLAQLAQFATDMATILARADVDWQWRPSEQEWSLTELSCHLRDVEREVHQPRFRLVLTQERPFLAGVSADEWAGVRGYAQENGRAALEAFLTARAQTIAMLQGLNTAVWQRQGNHAFFGLTTMQELLNLVVKHDQAHWRQAQALLQRGKVTG